MQDLVVGKRYKVSHPDGAWSGECTVTRVAKDGRVFYKDMLVIQRGALQDAVVAFVEKDWDQLYQFVFEPLHLDLENK